MRLPLFAVCIMLFVVAGCGGGGGGGSTAPTAQPTVPPATPTPVPTGSPVPTPTPTSAQPLSGSYTTSYQVPPATPFAASVPIQLFAQAQTATITASGGLAPYGGTLQFCSAGGGFGSPFKLVQNATNGAIFTLTATQFAGSCTVTLFDSSPVTRTLQVQAMLTTTSGTVQ